MERAIAIKKIHKILIANRGEIAARIVRSAKNLGIHTVVIFSEADRDAAYRFSADESFSLGAGSLADTYLNIQKIIAIAIHCKVDAIHPGYGFLSENFRFAETCSASNILFIGPPDQIIRLMGDKIESHRVVNSLGIPILKIYTGTTDFLIGLDGKLQYPVLIKAAAGGGGKGMKMVAHSGQLKEAIMTSSREAQNYFMDERVYIEKYLESPRHIEVQILADHHGNIVHLFERECSLQRRHQKIIEEAPSVTLSEELRNQITSAAIKIATTIGYRNAGTIEFLLHKNGQFYFLEMNTRIQVEHTVTELITGIDIVQEQIRICEGHPLSMQQQDIVKRGHAIEARVYAEDPENDFFPSPGKILLYKEPSLKNIRIDSVLKSGSMVNPDFDPLIGKIISLGRTREEAIDKLYEALNQFVILGIRHNLPFLSTLLQDRDFKSNQVSTSFVQERAVSLIGQMKIQQSGFDHELIIAALIVYLLINESSAKENATIWQQIGYWRMLPCIATRLNNHIYNVYYKKEEESSIQFSMNDRTLVASNYRMENDCIFFEMDHLGLKYHYALNEKGIIHLQKNANYYAIEIHDRLPEEFIHEQFENNAHADRVLKSTIFGKVVSIMVNSGEIVKRGDPLLLIESMKMENIILSPVSGEIENIYVKTDEQVKINALLLTIK